jgi:hypothetical protein
MATTISNHNDREPFSFKAFLSHRYKSPEDNLYFFKQFSEIAEVQFEVDEGTSMMNVTRVERMIRDSDAFIGIYPFPGTWDDAQVGANLQKASQYFRLELDLAIRSRKPAIIFYDKLYGNVLECPASVIARDFDGHEVRSPGGSPKADRYREAFKTFCEIVRKGMAYEVAQDRSPQQTVGVAVPEQTSWGGYRKYAKEIGATVRENWPGKVETIPWPPTLDRDSFILLQELDWAIVDIGKEMAETGIPAYLHGRFVPMMRLKHSSPSPRNASRSRFEQTLFSGAKVGYAEDILAWSNKQTLLNGIKQRIRAIKADVRRISTAEQATNYFQDAARRKEAVFFSYAGEDKAAGANLSAELKRQFQKVFDYRDQESIRAGQPWLDEIFDQLSRAAVGISLLSAGYMKSENCQHEARDLVARRDNKKITFLPVSLAGEQYATPSWLQSTQHLEWSEGLSAQDLVKRIIKLIV